MLRNAALLFVIWFSSLTFASSQQASTPRVILHSGSDVEVTVVEANGRAKPAVFLTHAYLTSLPQVSFPLKPDDNFPEFPSSGARVTGIDLNDLLKQLDPDDTTASLVAVCRDRYTAPFPRPAILDHHPILVLTIDGMSIHAWATRHHTYDPGPYFVTYKDFTPSFHLLAHTDFPQHPAEVIQLKVVPASHLFEGITPPTSTGLPTDSPVLTGFHIAQQNCFRCHNSGDTGGTKANRTWQQLAGMAKARPDQFEKWVHDPHSLDKNATMPANLKYDQPTLNALTRYFQSFAP